MRDWVRTWRPSSVSPDSDTCLRLCLYAPHLKALTALLLTESTHPPPPTSPGLPGCCLPCVTTTGADLVADLVLIHDLEPSLPPPHTLSPSSSYLPAPLRGRQVSLPPKNPTVSKLLEHQAQEHLGPLTAAELPCFPLPAPNDIVTLWPQDNNSLPEGGCGQMEGRASPLPTSPGSMVGRDCAPQGTG